MEIFMDYVKEQRTVPVSRFLSRTTGFRFRRRCPRSASLRRQATGSAFSCSAAPLRCSMRMIRVSLQYQASDAATAPIAQDFQAAAEPTSRPVPVPHAAHASKNRMNSVLV